MKRHEGHRLEPLEPLTEKSFPDASVFDPMSVGYVEVTNGRDRLLLRQMRRSIYEPLSFELVTGRLIEQGVTVGIQDNPIKKEMKYHFEWSAEPLQDDKIDLFIELYRDVVKEIKPEEIEVGGFSFDDANVSYGLPEPRVVDLLMVKCAAYFRSNELLDIRKFIDSHLEGCDVMALVMRCQIILDRPAA